MEHAPLYLGTRFRVQTLSPIESDPLIFRYFSTVICNIGPGVATPGVPRMSYAYRQLFRR